MNHQPKSHLQGILPNTKRDSFRRHCYGISSIRVEARRTSSILTLVMCLLTLTGCPPPPPGVINPVGGALSGFRDTLNSVISEATAKGEALLVTAAGQVDLAVSNAESSLAADLNKSLDSVDSSVRQTLDHLQTLVADVKTATQETLKTAIDGSQQLINSLPFTNKNPQVRSYSPQFSALTSNVDVAITVSGNFFWASEQGKQVTLTAGGETLQPTLSTTTTVGFTLPARLFSSSPDRFTPTSFTVHAPYEKGAIFPQAKVGDFRLLVTILPNQPLRALTLKNSTAVQGTETKQAFQPTQYTTDGTGWRVESWSNCKDNSDSHAISADPDGWQILPTSIAVGYIKRGYSPRGEASITAASPTGFVVEGKTQAACFLGISSNSGDIEYFVAYSQQRSVTTTNQETRDLLAGANTGMQWGDRLVVPVTKGGWHLHAVLWDGTVLETSGTEKSNKYFSVEDQGPNISISLVAPAQLAVS